MYVKKRGEKYIHSTQKWAKKKRRKGPDSWEGEKHLIKKTVIYDKQKKQIRAEKKDERHARRPFSHTLGNKKGRIQHECCLKPLRRSPHSVYGTIARVWGTPNNCEARKNLVSYNRCHAYATLSLPRRKRKPKTEGKNHMAIQANPADK